MGLFGSKKNKKNTELNASSEKPFTGAEIERDVTQDVAICMNQLKVTSMPMLKFLRNDQGILEGLYLAYINDPQMEFIKQAEGADLYLLILACHALGAGAYVTLCQSKYKKHVNEFTIVELEEISNAFHETDPYELAITELGYAPDGNNKQCLDRIALVGVEAYKNSAGNKVLNKDCLRSLMQVMFNAGVTWVYRD